MQKTLDEIEFFAVKKRAAGLVHKALKAGKLDKTPCMACGVSEVEAHHVDYARPLSVIWLCRRHHNQVHHPEKSRDKIRGIRWDVRPQDAFL